MKKNAIKVYMLMERHAVLGVFSSAKKANEARDWVLEHDMICKKNPSCLYIDIYELNGEWIERLI